MISIFGIIFLINYSNCYTIPSVMDKIKIFEQTNTGCPDNWTRYFGTDNKCIKVFEDPKNFVDALEYCQQFKNGTLVSIHNAFQNAQIGTHCKDLNKDWCSIGLYNFKRSDYRKRVGWP